MDGKTYQNKRCGVLFKIGKNGKPYYLDAIMWKNQNGVCYTGTALDKAGNNIKSRQYIKTIPFTPKTFYIDVIEEEIANNDFIFRIKDEKQLNEVYKIYDKRYQVLAQI